MTHFDSFAQLASTDRGGANLLLDTGRSAADFDEHAAASFNPTPIQAHVDNAVRIGLRQGRMKVFDADFKSLCSPRRYDGLYEKSQRNSMNLQEFRNMKEFSEREPASPRVAELRSGEYQGNFSPSAINFKKC